MENLVARISSLEKDMEEMKLRLMPASMQSAFYAMYVNDEFNKLKMLLNTPLWPQAVNPKFICNRTTEGKNDRANKILDFIIETPLEGLKFLDFGCGEGHVVKNSIRQRPVITIGYDIKASDQWQTEGPMLFTANIEDVKAHAPYDVILMYDVLDHLADEQKAVDTLSLVKGIMASRCKLYLQCHPWCSRHATHLYHKINKAFIHLVFTEAELESLGYVSDEKVTIKTIHPASTYSQWFRQAGLRILRNNFVEEHTEPFFSDMGIVADRIKKNWITSKHPNLARGIDFPHNHMKFQFADYVLTH